MSKWQECRLGEVAEIQTGPFGSQLKNSQYVTGGTPVITVEHIDNFRIIDFDYPSVTYEDKKRLSKYLLNQGDIIFTRVGSVDLSAYVQPHQQDWMFSSRMLRVRSDQRINSRFLSYFFQQNSFREYILSIAVGATMPSINTEILKSVPISYPSLPEQKAISSVLSSLDDKIDLLHRQNKTLEAMAETLFRQWFVEEDSGFREGCLADVAINVKEAIKASDLKSESKYIGLEHIDQRNIALKHYGFGSEVSSNKYAFQRHDILFGKLRPYFHKVCFAPFSGICSTDILVIRPIKSELFAFCLFAFFQDEVVEYANLSSGGTRMPRTDWTTLKNYPIAIPDSYSIERFNNAVSSSLKKISSNLEQIRTLETLRDTLLPKLMSGEVRVTV
ncbi:MAG TPA: restriction endonuclease subunit S [Nitrosomonas sp.]|nr:restriction endonuclease subunit S [Nitrosomonas sp.]HMW21169.1 restriction endonuclease subunit S [Nitrosomonas sp.]HMY90492.1 restriction endonuclease subunit S [Nitrosomonas sp.]HNB02493.1 restriction endonuclease subunit S [Nitrosomonas sp.]HNC41783.1 restriction endonuclease subunit S [Nitrosomonas sp.]